MGVRDSTGWNIGFVCGITIAAMAVTLWSYTSYQKKVDQRADFNRRVEIVDSVDKQVRKLADRNNDGLDIREVRSIAEAAGYEGPVSGIDSIMIYDPLLKRDFDGGMLYPRSDMYLQGMTLYIPVADARRAESRLRGL